jgi:hypothetical protein
VTGGKEAGADTQTKVEYVSADRRVVAEGTRGRTHTDQERSALGGKEADERSVGHVMHLSGPRDKIRMQPPNHLQLAALLALAVPPISCGLASGGGYRWELIVRALLFCWTIHSYLEIQRWGRRGQREIEEGLRGGPEVLACPEIQLFKQLSFTSPGHCTRARCSTKCQSSYRLIRVKFRCPVRVGSPDD